MYLYNKALALDPDYEPGLLNKAGLLLIQDKKQEAVILLKRVLKRNPSNQQAKQALQQLKINI